LEQRIPDISGLQIQRRLAAENCYLPMVYTTSSVDVSTAVNLMRGGAVHILEKPLRPIELLNAIQEALSMAASHHKQGAERRRLLEAIAKLTRKERQLITLLAAAKPTKVIAAELKICQRAVEMRRSVVMEKLGLHSLLELVYFAVRAFQECRALLDFAMTEAAEDPEC
jgi:two-component system, LuxR family, response regulator FixJ